MTLISKWLCTAAVMSAATPALAQSIEVERLGAAKAFAPGIDIAGALDSEAWQGTSAQRAARLLEGLPDNTSHPIVRDMLRRVVLSGLAPPSGADEAFERRRIMAAQELASPDEYARFVARNPAARDPALRVDAYIARGDLAAACDISDAIQQGRAEPDWIRLRAACHELRGETAAADLARDILRDRGEDPDLIVPKPAEGFWVEAMALDAADLNAMMETIAGDPGPAGPPEADEGAPETDAADIQEESLADTAFNDPDEPAAPEPSIEPTTDPIIEPIPLFAAPEPEPEPLPTFDLAEAMTDTSDQGTARLFILGRDGNAKAVSEFVARASEAGIDPSRVLSRVPAVLDAADMASANLPLFARYAVLTRDIVLMQALFGAADDDAAKERLALASDAMGGGFYGRALGDGLETALENDGRGAARDVLIALALGSDLTDPVETRLRGSLPTGTANTDWLAADHAVERGAQAESLLRFAAQVDAHGEDDPWALYRAIRGLRRLGFSDLAGQLAAYEFLRRL